MMDCQAALAQWDHEETLVKMELLDRLDLLDLLDQLETEDHLARQELGDSKECPAKEVNLESLVRMAMLASLVSQA